MSKNEKLIFFCPFCKKKTWHKKEDKYFDGSGTRYRCYFCSSLIEKGSPIEDIETYLRWCEEDIRAGFKNLKKEFGVDYEEVKDRPISEILELIKGVE